MSETADQLKARFTAGKTVTSESMNAVVDALAVSSTTKETLKSYFETGDKPTQAQFYSLIDAIFAQKPKAIAITNQNVAAGHAYRNAFTKQFNIQTGPKFVQAQNVFNVVMMADTANYTEFEIRNTNTDIYNTASTCMSGAFYLDIAMNFNLYGYNNVMQLMTFTYIGILPICYGNTAINIVPANAVKLVGAASTLYVWLYASSLQSSNGQNVHLNCITGLSSGGFGSNARLISVNIQSTKLYCYTAA